jgi:hypothetical protein
LRVFGVFNTKNDAKDSKDSQRLSLLHQTPCKPPQSLHIISKESLAYVWGTMTGIEKPVGPMKPNHLAWQPNFDWQESNPAAGTPSLAPRTLLKTHCCPSMGKAGLLCCSHVKRGWLGAPLPLQALAAMKHHKCRLTASYIVLSFT